MLLQVPEQREAAEAEIQAHSMVQHRNVVQLISSEIQSNADGTSTAFLLFPYYCVSGLSDGSAVRIAATSPVSEWNAARLDGAV